MQWFLNNFTVNEFIRISSLTRDTENHSYSRDSWDRLLKGKRKREGQVQKINLIFLPKFTWGLIGEMVNSREGAEGIQDEPVATETKVVLQSIMETCQKDKQIEGAVIGQIWENLSIKIKKDRNRL